MSRIPDMTERFPEGLNGVDMTDRLIPPDGMVDNEDYSDEYEEKISGIKEEFQIDNNHLAYKIYQIRRRACTKMAKIIYESEMDIVTLLEDECGLYVAEDDLPF